MTSPLEERIRTRPFAMLFIRLRPEGSVKVSLGLIAVLGADFKKPYIDML